MPRERLQIVINGKDNASRAFRSVSGSVNKLGQITLRAATMGIAALTTGLAAASAGAIKLASDSAKMITVEKAFNNMTQSAGLATDDFLKSMQGASAGMITNTELMKNYNMATQLVGESFAEQLPDAMEMVGKVSAATGEDIGFLMDSLTRGIGRLSPKILDNLGIQVSLNEAYESYASEVGKSTKELTKNEQQTALTNQVMSLLAENTKDMPEIAGSAESSFKSFGTTLKNIRDNVGKTLAKAFAPLMDVFGDIAEDIGPKLNTFIQEKITPAIEDLGEALGLLMEGDKVGALRAIFSDEMANKILLVEFNLGLFLDKLDRFVNGEYAPEIKGAKNALLGLAGTAVALQILGVIIGAISWPIALLITAVAGLGAAWGGNWGGIQDKLKKVWNETLKPALKDLWTWLKENIPKALQTLKEFWLETLLPALKKVWKFLSEDMQPIWEALGELIKEIYNIVGPALVGFWENVLHPALKAVWKFIRDNIVPIFKKWSDKMGGIKGIIDGIAEGIGGFTEKLRKIKLPKWLQTDSPTPFEQGLRGINNAMDELVTKNMPKLNSELSMAGAGASGATIASGSSSTNIINIDSVNASNQEDVDLMVDKIARRLKEVR